LSLKTNDRTKIMLHLGQAIDAQTKQQDDMAAEELDKAVEAGFNDPAIHFDLGLLRSSGERVETALRHLQHAVKNEDYAMAARLLMGQIERKLGRLSAAVAEYMEALKTADALVVPPEQANELRQLYEPLIEAQNTQTDQAYLEQLCNNIHQLLVRPNWRAQVAQAREQLPKTAEDSQLLPLAEILTQAQSSQVIDAITKVRHLAREGHLRSAMDEAFESLKYAPSYLPLHSLIGDLLIQEGRNQDAITKYSVVAQAYSVRGEAAQAVTLLRRIVTVAPMDLAARTRLIDQLAARGQLDEAISEYMDLAEIYYRLAELDMARKTYTTALRLAQQGGAKRTWSVKLMRRMADIDMQRLDLRQAMRIFEQIRTIEPGDLGVRKSLIDLNLRLNQPPQAAAELDNMVAYLQSASRRPEAIPFLEDLLGEYPQQAVLRKYLAEEYRQAEKFTEAIEQLDVLGDMLLTAGDRAGAIQAIEGIVALNPPNIDDYRTLLAKVKSEA
jgi:tetratricopeptide (TPR) repeat protein